MLSNAANETVSGYVLRLSKLKKKKFYVKILKKERMEAFKIFHLLQGRSQDVWRGVKNLFLGCNFFYCAKTLANLKILPIFSGCKCNQEPLLATRLIHSKKHCKLTIFADSDHIYSVE